MPTFDDRQKMKKVIIPIICSIFALSVGYLIGGMRAGRIATKQAYHADLNFHIAVTKYLEENKIEEAKELSKQAIRGTLNVLDTFEDEPRSPLVFVLPSSETLLDSAAKEEIRAQANLTISEEVAALGSIQSR